MYIVGLDIVTINLVKSTVALHVFTSLKNVQKYFFDTFIAETVKYIPF